MQKIDALVKELSHQSDPDRLVRVFTRRADLFYQHEAVITADCRGLEAPAYRLTRSWRWGDSVNPFTQSQRLPVYNTGLLGQLLHSGQPQIIDELHVEPDDPCLEHLEGFRSLACAPNYHQGRPLSMIALLHNEPSRFTMQDLETLLLNTNLLGRAVTNLALAQQLEDAYRKIDHEMRRVGAMQRHLLPSELPYIEGLSLGASYSTCDQAGGDYYDVLELPDGKWAIFLADVSGHGVSAAVMMAVIRTLLHSLPVNLSDPQAVMSQLNEHLLSVVPEGMFATAFYGVYEAGTRRLRYTQAGHPSPRLRRGNKGIQELPRVSGLPLGVMEGATWKVGEITFQLGDAMVLFSDGLIEGNNPAGEPFGVRRLDESLRLAPLLANPMVRHIERHYRDFCAGEPDHDDRTILAAVAVP